MIEDTDEFYFMEISNKSSEIMIQVNQYSGLVRALSTLA